MHWPWQQTSSLIVGLMPLADRLAWVELPPGEGGRVLAAGSETVTAPDTALSLFHSLAAQRRWKGACLQLVLPSRDYQLVLVEPPNVPPEEWRDALRFRVSDLVSMPMSDAALDVFALPDDAYRGRQKMAYVAVCQQRVVDAWATAATEAKLALAGVTIPEIALLRLKARLAPGPDSTALVHIADDDTRVMLCQDDQLYLVRQTPFGTAALGQPEQREALVLEVQRSMDYYDSQIGKGTVRQVLLAGSGALADLSSTMQDLLGLRATILSAAELLTEGSGTDGLCLPALGAALREVA